jgi:signal transduction histidine kinase
MIMDRFREIASRLPIVSGIIGGLRGRRETLAADPFRQAHIREERLWLLALLIIFLLAVSLFLITATDEAAGVVPEIAVPVISVLGSDITTCFLLVMVLLITAYIHERLQSHWIENRHLIEQLTQRERALRKKDAQLTTWGELSHALIANFELPRLLDLIVTTAMEVTDAERGSVMLLDTEENVLTIKAAKGIDDEVVRKTRLRLGEGIAGRVAFTGKPLLLHREEKDKQLHAVRKRDDEISSAISVPLRIEDRIVGTLNVSETSRPAPFREEDMRALTLFADQAALAIEKAQLYRDSQRQLEKLLAVLDELGRTQAQLIHSEKLASLGVLAGGVAHEINNPLMVILGRTELMLMDDAVSDRGQGPGSRVSETAVPQTLNRKPQTLDPRPPLSPEMKKNLETICNETERIARIVQNLLTFSRKSRQEKIERVSVKDVLERTLMLSEHQLTIGNVKVMKELDANLPEIDANSGQLQQVFMNLIINAHHAMPEGGELTIRTGTVPDDRVFIEIADTGCGIAPEYINRIFDPFFTTKEEGKGTGLGLAVSRNIIDSHGGDIGVRSAVGLGTTFRVILPRVTPLQHPGSPEGTRRADSPFHMAAAAAGPPAATLGFPDRADFWSL